jgi:hypothetical protein
LTESGQTGVRALAAVAGLVARRQLGLWTSWRPWVASLGLLPVLIAFSNLAWSVACITERYPWKNTPLSHQEIVLILCSATLLTAVCSWVVGFVISSMVRRAAASAAALMAVGVVVWMICQRHAAYTPSGMVSGLFQLVLCLTPYAHGLHSGAGRGRLTPGRSLLLATAALLLEIVLLRFQLPATRDLFMLAFFSWPMLYLLATARQRVPSAI